MSEKYVFKEIPLSDLEEVIALIDSVFMEFEAPDYSKEGIKEFKDFIEYNTMRKKIQLAELKAIGCYDEEKLIGMIGYNLKSHINLLFIDKKYHKQGIARTLVNQVLKECRSKNEQFVITVNSSPYAHKVYEKLGFRDMGGEQILNGIRFIPMRYSE